MIGGKGMKAIGRNILGGILCIIIFLVIAVAVFTKAFEPQEGALHIADDVTSAEIVYEKKVYSLEREQLEKLTEFFRKLEATEYDTDIGKEEKGIIVKFFAGEKEVAKYGVTDKETILSYACDPDAVINIFKTATDVETYLLELIENK